MDFHFLTGSQRSFIIPSKGQVSRAYTWGANFHGCFPTFLSTLRQVTLSSEGRVNNKIPIKKGERSVLRKIFLPWISSFFPLSYLRSFSLFVFRIRSTAVSVVGKIPQRVCCHVEQNWVHPQ